MKGRKHRETGGVNAAKSDLDDKPEARTNAKKIDAEAAERKSGGRAARKRGGAAEKKCLPVSGEKSAMRADRKPRKNGGRTGADSNPFSSARHGTVPAGRKVETEMD